MTQSPFLTDQIQIEPGAAGTRIINRSSGGSLQFQDPDLTVLLKDLSGSRNITGVFVVGRAGSGAAYTTIQDALDAIPTSSSINNPSVVIVYPGVYTENLSVQKDGVTLIGVGEVMIVNSGSNDTISITASLDVTPTLTTLQNLIVVNDVAGKSCVKILGADSFASGTVTVINAPLSAGDTLTVGGNVLTGIAGVRSSGGNNFSVLVSTPNGMAAEIAAALNDPANAFVTTVEASVAGPDITLDAIVAGSDGNAITLASLTSPAGGLVLSGGTLTGGGSAGSQVASRGLWITSCNLQAVGAGNYLVYAETVNNIYITGGTCEFSDSSADSYYINVSTLSIANVAALQRIAMSYSSSLDLPSTPFNVYSVRDCGSILHALLNFVDTASMSFSGIPDFGILNLAGSRTVQVSNSSMGNIGLDDTAALVLVNTSRNNASFTGTPTLSETDYNGSIGFVASASETFTFDVEQPDSSYLVFLELPSLTNTFAVTNKTTTTFDIEANPAFTGTINFSVRRGGL